MHKDELAGWLRLALTERVGNAGCRKLLAAFGLPDAIFTQSLAALSQVVTEPLARALHSTPPGLAELLERTWQWLQGNGASPEARRIVTLGDEHYPAGLLSIEDPPPMLYMTGLVDAPIKVLTSLAIVGSRNPTPQGELNARQFAQSLCEAGLTIVSGMALGVDAAAHRGALAAAGQSPRLRTVAVVGTGLDRVYPGRHLSLARDIAAKGLIVSEFPLGTPPLQANFPKRNRIIAGLTQGTLVVEANLKSGSLITAKQAAEQGKEVFAIPGSIHAPQAQGCHWLIKQGAKLVVTAQDVLEELRWPEPVAPSPRAQALKSGGAEPAAPASSASRLVEAMGFDPVSLDALQARTGESTAQLQATLLELELDETIARLPGGLFQRLVRV